MSEFLFGLGIILFFGSIVAFFVGILMLFFERSRVNGMKVILGAIIAFIVGFGSCAAGGNLK